MISSLGIPVVEDRNYWVVRTNGGSLYQDFLLHDYISIGWDYITPEMIKRFDEEYIKRIIFAKQQPEIIADPSKGQKMSLSSTYSKIRRFCVGMKINDVVIVPSASSHELSIGIIKSDVYEDDNYATRYEEANPDSEITLSTHIKRRKVKWVKSQAREADIYLSRSLYSQHTLSIMNESKDLINRSIFPIYMQDESIHATFFSRNKEGVQLNALRNFLDAVDQTARGIAIQFGEPAPSDLQIKLALNSPGILEIVSVASSVVAAGSVALFAFNQLINGGKLELKYKKENGTIEFSVESESKGLKGHMHEMRKLEFDNQKILDAARELNLVAGVLPDGESRLYLDAGGNPGSPRDVDAKGD